MFEWPWSFKPDTNDSVIVVMGPTGCGKSNFINKLAGNTEQRQAGCLKSDTQNVTPYTIPFHGHRLVLVDTPGFDDTYLPDAEVLRRIADWLTQKYPGGDTLKISGLIYLHRITDNRMSGSAQKNLQVFGRLCGDLPLRRTRLVTTMWDSPGNEATARKRETQLKGEFWRPLIEGGAAARQFHNTPASAWEVIEDLRHAENDDGELLLQEELVEQQKHLNETEAGKVLYTRLQKLLAEQRRTLKELSEEAKLQNDPTLARSLREEYEKIDGQLQQTFEEIKEMKIPLTRRILIWLFGRRSRAKAIELD